MLPSNTGGTNWPGGALDPETNILYIYSFTNVVSIGLINDPARSDMDFGQGRATRSERGAASRRPAAAAAARAAAAALTVQGLPLIKPPYGRITAIDLNKGDLVWQVAHGDTPDAVRNHPALKGLNIPRTGRTNGRIGTLVTKSLVIAGEPGFNTTPNGRGAMLRAYDKATGAGCRRRLHAGAADRIADDLHAERQAVPRRRGQRRGLQRRASGVRPTVAGSTRAVHRHSWERPVPSALDVCLNSASSDSILSETKGFT